MIKDSFISHYSRIFQSEYDSGMILLPWSQFWNENIGRKLLDSFRKVPREKEKKNKRAK